MRRSHLLLAALLVAGCAQVRDLGGGERDVQPPVLVEAVPPPLTTGFTGRRILLRFNERVKVGNVRDQLLISPPLQRAPDVTVQGGTAVLIELHEELRPATTYSFFLGDAVTDLTEGNPAAGLHYVLSTGNEVDSGHVAGIVLDALSGAPAGGVHVSLYAPEDTAAFRTGRPTYATRSDALGRYRLSNLREGTYALRALRDQNADLRYDLPNEELAFADHPVVTGQDTATVLRLFREAPAQQQVLDQRVEADRAWLIACALPARALTLRDLDFTGGSLTWHPERNASGDTLRLWPSDTTALNGRSFELRDDTLVLDTLRYRVREKMPYHVVLGLAAAGDTLVLKATRPLATVDPGLIRVLHDSTTVPAETRSDPERPLELRVIVPAGTHATRVELLPKAVTDVYGGTNDTLRLKVVRPRPEDLGRLTVTVAGGAQGPAGDLLLRLRTTQGGIQRDVRMHGPERATFEGVDPGTYRLELVEDRNGNGRWDPGSLRGERQPERTWTRGATVTVRAGWAIEETWTVDGP